MKKIVLTLLLAIFVHTNVAAQDIFDIAREAVSAQSRQSAKITFQNKSDYVMTVKVLGFYGGLYRTVTLSAQSSSTVYFKSTATYKLKIKAQKGRYISYHKGGSFTVTCTPTEWTEGTMTFTLSSYGTGLGPTISKQEFENNN